MRSPSERDQRSTKWRMFTEVLDDLFSAVDAWRRYVKLFGSPSPDHPDAVRTAGKLAALVPSGKDAFNTDCEALLESSTPDAF